MRSDAGHSGSVSTENTGRPQDAETLARVLGGRASAIDASLPPAAFGAAYLLNDGEISTASIAALAISIVIAGWRIRRGARPLAVLVSVLGVIAGAIIALRTGNAADFFLVRFGSNVLSALGWIISIMLRWPFLGLIVGALLRQGRRWRRDPDLLRAYNRASWVWVGQYVLRLAVFLPLWQINAVAALSIAQVALTWPLVAVCIAASWWVLRRVLPQGHPGINHPREVVAA